MRAWVVQNYNQPLELTDVPEPSPSDHDVLVEIHVTAVNVLDVKVQAAEFKAILSYKPPLPPRPPPGGDGDRDRT